MLMWKTLCILVKKIRFEAVCSLLFLFKGDGLFILFLFFGHTARLAGPGIEPGPSLALGSESTEF